MRYNLLSFLCAATVIAYLQRSALGVPSKTIERELGLTSQDMGLVWLAWYAGYAGFQLPSGWVADRLGSKRALILFALLWSGLTAVVGTATGFTGLWVLWGAMGVAQAGIFVCATKAIGATFPKTEQAFASGSLACCMAGGAALSQYVTGRLLGALAWPEILAVYALPGLFWAVAFAALVPSPDAPRVRTDAPERPVRWSRLLTDPRMALLCVQQFLRAAATALFFTWFPRYLQETKGLTPAESGGYAAWPLLAGMVGGLLGGTLSDWLLRQTGSNRFGRQLQAVVAMALCTVAAVGAFFAADVTTTVLLVCVSAFSGYLAGPVAYATAITMGGKRVAPVFATMNMAGNIGAGIFPFAVGRLADTTGNWNLTLLLFGGLYASSGLCWAFLNPRGPLFEDPDDDPR
jgi:MFS family permease